MDTNSKLMMVNSGERENGGLLDKCERISSCFLFPTSRLTATRLVKASHEPSLRQPPQLYDVVSNTELRPLPKGKSSLVQMRIKRVSIYLSRSIHEHTIINDASYPIPSNPVSARLLVVCASPTIVSHFPDVRGWLT